MDVEVGRVVVVDVGRGVPEVEVEVVQTSLANCSCLCGEDRINTSTQWSTHHSHRLDHNSQLKPQPVS